jgi:hypothetical protein
MAEWSKDHVAAIWFLNLNFKTFGRAWLNWRPSGTLGEKWRSSVGKVGKWYMESRHIQDCSPCLCQLRIDGLASRANIKRTNRMLIYEPSNPSSLLLTVVWLSPLLLWLWGWEKLDGDTQINQLACWGCSREFFFLVSSDSVQLCWRLREGLLYVDRVRYVWSRIIHGLSVKIMWRIGRVFPCMVYIDSNRRNSRIWVSLVCGSHHVDNLMNLIWLMQLMLYCFNLITWLQLLYD